MTIDASARYVVVTTKDTTVRVGRKLYPVAAGAVVMERDYRQPNVAKVAPPLADGEMLLKTDALFVGDALTADEQVAVTKMKPQQVFVRADVKLGGAIEALAKA